MAEPLTAEHLRSILNYDPETGLFSWRRNGKPAGYVDTHGYVKIMVAYKNYYGHRLAWLHVHGTWPAAEIDHVDGDRGNTKLANLREASRVQNGSNTKRKSSNASGFKGVCWEKFTGKWKAEIRRNYKRHTLGRFDTAEEAHSAYCAAAERLHGEFARVA